FRAVDADAFPPNQIWPDKDVADAKLPAQRAFLDRAAIEVTQVQIGIGEVVLKIDDGLNAQSSACVRESVRCELSAAVDNARRYLAQPFVVRVHRSIKHNRRDADDGHDQRR